MSENKKSPLEKAYLEAKEIENAALNGAKKALEESVISKIDEAVKETIKEIEKNSLKENVSIEVGDAEVSVDVKDGVTTIEVGANEEDLIINPISSEEDSEEEMDFDEEMDSEEDEMNSEEEDEDMEEIFEIAGLFEDDEVAAEAPVEELPVEETPIEEVPADDASAIETADLDVQDGEEVATTVEIPTASAFQDLSSKIDMILSQLNSANTVSSDANAEEVDFTADEESVEDPSIEGEVEIVDDEAATASPEELPADEEMVTEYDDMALESMISELMSEIEIVNEEDEEEMDDMLDIELDEATGLGSGVNRAFGNKNKENGHHAPIAPVHESIAHDEVKLTELIKENESLKESLKEYKESFKVLRKQINEVQTFNAKLAYVNKLFSKGGLTNDEKVRIAENFDEVTTVEEAKVLYNKIISENTNLSEGKTEQLKSKLKSTNPAVVNSTKSETLYESTEISRMKQLAGIRTLKN